MGKNTEILLDLLKITKYGMSVNKIAEKLDWHRNTVSKYLNILKGENKVFCRDIGQYKLWIYNDPRGINEMGDPNLLLNAYFLFLKSLQKLHPEIKDGKEIGKLISHELQIEDYIPLDFQNLINKFDLNQIASILMDALNNFYIITYEKYNFDPPFINQDPPFIILRIKDSNYIDIPLHFQMLTGVIEDKIQNLYNINVKVSIPNINKEQRIIDIKINFDDSILRNRSK